MLSQTKVRSSYGAKRLETQSNKYEETVRKLFCFICELQLLISQFFLSPCLLPIIPNFT